MPSLIRFLDWVTFKSKTKMAQNGPLPTQFIKHPYQNVEILQECLVNFGFKEKQWKIIVSD